MDCEETLEEGPSFWKTPPTPLKLVAQLALRSGRVSSCSRSSAEVQVLLRLESEPSKSLLDQLLDLLLEADSSKSKVADSCPLFLRLLSAVIRGS